MTEPYSPGAAASTPSHVWAVWRDVPTFDVYAPQTTRIHACVLYCGASEEAAQTFARAWREASGDSPQQRAAAAARARTWGYDDVVAAPPLELQVGPMVGSSWAAERGVFDALSEWARTNPNADQLTIRRVADQARVKLREVAAWCPACASRQAVATVLGIEVTP